MWLRQNPEYCAQRKTQADFRVHQAPEIKFLGYFCWFSAFGNLRPQSFQYHNLKMLMKSISKIKFQQFFQIFQNFQFFLCPWVRPRRRSIFSPEFFQKLILAESESRYQTVGLDKRKSQTIDRLSSTEPKRYKK